jgi:hypothetical protein
VYKLADMDLECMIVAAAVVHLPFQNGFHNVI